MNTNPDSKRITRRAGLTAGFLIVAGPLLRPGLSAAPTHPLPGSGGSSALQDGQDRPRFGPVGGGEGATEKRVWKASDGEDAAPGRIPKDTTSAARALWEELTAFSRIGDLATGPIQTFDLPVDVKVRSTSTNQTDARIAYVADRSWLRVDYARDRSEAKRFNVRGPAGDWLVDREQGEPTELRGRVHRRDVEQLDALVALARNFSTISFLEGLRIVRLQVMPPIVTAPRARLKAVQEGEPRSTTLATVQDSLTWLELTSPDFQVTAPAAGGASRGSGPSEALHRAYLGWDPKHRLLRLAVIHDVETLNDVTQLPNERTLYVSIERWEAVGSHRLPSLLRVFQSELTPDGPLLPNQANIEFGLFPGARLNEPLDEALFRP